MEIFYPSDMLDVINVMFGFYCFAFAARLGWRYADWMLRKIAELRELFQKKDGL